mmetsp:Transcript_7847/g.13664  ORF Transcript_7847/g.13664 Transcript_7847/m.13664 type:complete len:237 (-) Transcript_7847:38-748(-)
MNDILFFQCLQCKFVVGDNSSQILNPKNPSDPTNYKDTIVLKEMNETKVKLAEKVCEKTIESNKRNESDVTLTFCKILCLKCNQLLGKKVIACDRNDFRWQRDCHFLDLNRVSSYKYGSAEPQFNILHDLPNIQQTYALSQTHPTKHKTEIEQLIKTDQMLQVTFKGVQQIQKQTSDAVNALENELITKGLMSREAGEFQCLQENCGETFTRKSALKLHLKTHKTDNVADSDEEDR